MMIQTCAGNVDNSCTGKLTFEYGKILSETCNPDRGCLLGSGINVDHYHWVKQIMEPKIIYKLLIRYEWLPGVIVPFKTEGEIRTSRVQMMEVLKTVEHILCL